MRKFSEIRVTFNNIEMSFEDFVKKSKNLGKIVVYFHGLPDDYRINWNKPKESYPRVNLRHFVDLSCQEDTEGSSPHWQVWRNSIEVEDISGALPEVLYIVVGCFGDYYNFDLGRMFYGGSSWYADNAFVSGEKALEYARTREEGNKWKRFWVVPCKIRKG